MNLLDLREQCLSCQKCSLAKSRTNVVFGEGNPDSVVMFVGEGPGRYEDETGKPFVGRSGKLLDNLMGAVGIKREEVYIANIVKCRPPQNRDPLPEEQDICIGWLQKQLEIIKPEILVCLGRVSAMRIIDPDFKVTRQHGDFFEKDGFIIMGTFHPSALLRNPGNKIPALSDFKKLAEKVAELKENRG
ncbi:MAG: uracil-DNA glycosylase [Ruminococcaceae bacterium]|nr:uracil-DNA glycosylase [Oscillospiraceae bacterium]